MSAKEARKELSALLSTALPKDWAVFDEVGSLDDVRTPTVHLIRNRVERLPESPQGAHLHTFALWLIMPQHSSEDALDDALDELIDVLIDQRVKWDGCDRDLYGGSQLPAYRVGITTRSIRKADS